MSAEPVRPSARWPVLRLVDVDYLWAYGPCPTWCTNPDGVHDDDMHARMITPIDDSDLQVHLSTYRGDTLVFWRDQQVGRVRNRITAADARRRAAAWLEVARCLDDD